MTEDLKQASSSLWVQQRDPRSCSHLNRFRVRYHLRATELVLITHLRNFSRRKTLSKQGPRSTPQRQLLGYFHRMMRCSHSHPWALVHVCIAFGKSPVEVHCAAVSACIVGVRDGCRLRARRLIIFCILFCRQVSLISLLWRMAKKLEYLCRCDEHFD